MFFGNNNNSPEYKKVIDYVYDKIEDGNLTIGSKLPTERAISEELSISRNSTREALKTLECMGLITRKQGSGNYISADMKNNLREMINVMLLVNSISKEDVCSFRRFMEKTTCEAIINKPQDAEWFKKMYDLLSETNDYSDMKRASEADREFHFRLIDAVDNAFLSMIMYAVTDVYRKWIEDVIARIDEDAKLQLAKAHRGILDGLYDKDMEKCNKYINLHYNIIEEYLREWEDYGMSKDKNNYADVNDNANTISDKKTTSNEEISFNEEITSNEETVSNKKYKAVIFDLDGTLLDTLNDLASSVNYALSTYNMPLRTIDEVRRFVGNGIEMLIRRAVPPLTSDELIEKVFAVFKEHYKEHCADTTKAYDGINELLNLLKKSGLKIAVVSNKADFAVRSLCDDYFNGIFDYVVGERANIKKKPAPDSVNEVLRYFNIDASKAVYVGDSDVDVDTARNANMDCIGVAWGFRGYDFLKEHGADMIINEPHEIISLINK